jgi:metal-responsive CopG/Arc/MetJ family transcriptional regulator
MYKSYEMTGKGENITRILDRPATVAVTVEMSKPLLETVDAIVKELKLWNSRSEFIREATLEHIRRHVELIKNRGD